MFDDENALHEWCRMIGFHAVKALLNLIIIVATFLLIETSETIKLLILAIG